jgi:hypothetical protein
MELRQGSTGHSSVYPTSLDPRGDTLLHTKLISSSHRKSTIARNFGEPPTKSGCRPSVSPGKKLYVAGFLVIVRLRWPPRHGTHSADPVHICQGYRSVSHTADRSLASTADCWCDGAAGNCNSTRRPAIAEGDHRRSRRHVWTRPCWSAARRLQAPVPRRFTDDHEVSDEGIRLSVLRRGE